MARLRQVGAAINRILAGPEGYAVPGSLVGVFQLSGGRLSGEVVDEEEAKHLDIAVQVMRAGKVLLTAPACQVGSTNRYSFELATDDQFAPLELMRNKVAVIARGARGRSGTLRMDGAAELELVREYLGVPIETICDIQFTRDGNLADYTGAGWSGPEAHSTWTEDDDSFLRLPMITAAGMYGLRLTTGAMVSPPQCPRQTVEMFLNGVEIWRQDISHSHPQFFEIKFDGAAFLDRELELRIHHPEALRLADHEVGGDPRRLALSVKRLALVRFLEAAAAAGKRAL